MAPPRQVDLNAPGFGDVYDELPLWSAPFGLLLLERIPMRAGAVILDVGCGTGFLALELAQRCGSEAVILAVDSWKEATARLRRKMEHLGLENIRILDQDAATLELPEGNVDLAVSNLGINNFEDPEAVLGACHRLMKPGGRIYLTTNPAGHMAEFYGVFESTLRTSGEAASLPALDAHIAHRRSPESVAALLAGIGFRVVETVTRSFRMRFADGSAFLEHSLIRFGFRPGWEALVPEPSRPRVFRELEYNLNAHAAAHGGLDLTVPVALVGAEKPGR